MLISEGKFYKRRNGQVVGPIVKTDAAGVDYVFGVGRPGGTYWCKFDEFNTFTSAGLVFSDDETEYDLVEECNADGSPIEFSRQVDIKFGLDPNGNRIPANPAVQGTIEGPWGVPCGQVGRKYDAEKPWAGTVLAGFWCDELEKRLIEQVERNMGEGAIDAVVGMISAGLDVTKTVPERLYAAHEAMCNLMLDYAVKGAVAVGTYGARKYERDNWLHVTDGVNRYYEAFGRHVLQILAGKWIDTPDDTNDPGSGLPNLDHICWCIFAGDKLADKAES